jgi:hypothetical protein
MFDYYGLGADFPGGTLSKGAEAAEKAKSIEVAFHKAVSEEMGHTFHPNRFIPYIQMHEFEGMLFSDPGVLAIEVGSPELADRFGAIRSGFPTPEDIDDGPTTAPSKRIAALVPTYDKVFYGNVVAIEIGLDGIRSQCPHFSDWLRRLESLGEST